MSVKELPVFPQFTLSASQGKIGTRKWVLSGESVDNFLDSIYDSTWPGDENTRLMQLQVGAFDEKLNVTPESGGAPSGGELGYRETLVVAQYQFMLFDQLWPHCIPKPAHPDGTTLSLRVRGSGQFLTMPPGAFVVDGVDKQIAFTQNENCRIVIPITEYHLTCDRMLAGDVPGWKYREGTVNSDEFLGEPPESLLFDTWELDHSFAPCREERMRTRYKLTCVLRSRDIPVGPNHYGWNYDYHGTKWVRIKIKEAGALHDRYPLKIFTNLFTDNGCAAGGSSDDGGSSWSGGF